MCRYAMQGAWANWGAKGHALQPRRQFRPFPNSPLRIQFSGECRTADHVIARPVNWRYGRLQIAQRILAGADHDGLHVEPLLGAFARDLQATLADLQIRHTVEHTHAVAYQRGPMDPA